MSSKNKTALGLSQWEGTDTPERLDFNSDNLLTDWALQERVKKVKTPTTGNFAVLTGDGGIQDSGKAPGKPGGVATLTTENKLAQMPTVADVGGSNPNLLDNWYFGPGLINQRGKNQYSGAFVYAVDRWATGQNATLTVDPDGGKLFGYNDLDNNYIFQRLEHLAMGTYTFSLLFSENTGQVQISNAYTDNNTVPAPSSTESAGLLSFSFVNAHNMTSSLACFRIHATAQCRPIAVKLELSTTQSLARQEIGGNWVLNDPPPNPALELLKCQRYQLITTENSNFVYGRIEKSKATAILAMPTPVSLRANPTISNINIIIVNNGVAVSIENAAPVNSYSSRNAVQFVVALPENSGLAPFEPVSCYVTSPIILDANL